MGGGAGGRPARPYFAPLAVSFEVVQPTVYDSLSRAFQRVAGVVAGVAAALAVSHFLAPSGWSIGIIVFAGLLAGWAARLGPQGVVQIPVSALLVFLVGRVTPGYGADRIIDTLIGAAVAVIAVLLTPSAPGPDAVMSRALAPLRRCTEILRAMSTGIGSPWTPEQAESWRRDALALANAVAARLDHEGHRLSTPVERPGQPGPGGARSGGTGPAFRRPNLRQHPLDRPGRSRERIGPRSAQCRP